RENDLAYQADNGDVNFAVRRFPRYGRRSGKSLDDLRAGERVAVGSGKQDPLDFVLWKAAKADEPADATWPSSLGPGRPGWHIECSAMATALLGETLDIHGGGADLQFPHHENEIAQSEGAHFHGRDGRFVNYWIHNGFVRIDNEKMSKSLGNFFTVREVLRRFDPEVLRLFILRAHYRSPLNYSDAHLEDARASLLRLYNAIDHQGDASDDLRAAADGPGAGAATASVDAGSAFAERFREAMDDDFNTPVAVAVLFDMAAELNRKSDAGLERELRRLAGQLGLLARDPSEARRSGLHGADAAAAGAPDDAAIAAAIAERADAKA